jgi:hypothetical protein
MDGTSEELGGNAFRLKTAQAIHKNLVKVPEYCFDHIDRSSVFSDYLYGSQSAGIVDESGAVEVDGLKNGIYLFYSNDLGLVIEKASAKENV